MDHVRLVGGKHNLVSRIERLELKEKGRTKPKGPR